ncbi:MAG TPA: ABC transporter permease [Gemmatimonadaceae bacterium]|nr:ABC transporter permease [Gemmatimonadaceae bacterium]
MHFLLQDLRHSARSLAKSPGLALVAVLALSLGIGLTTMMFSIVHGALLRGLPFPDGNRIMVLDRTNPSRNIEGMSVTIHELHDWREQQRSFGALAGFYTGTVNVSGLDRPERFDGAFVTANTFDVLGATALLGRTFREGEDSPGVEPVIVLGYALWKNRYGGDQNVLGRTIRANGREHTVVGVMPENFGFPVRQEVWLPLQLDPLALPRGEGIQLDVVGRLGAGLTLDQAQVEMNAIAARIAEEYPRTNEGVGARVRPFIYDYIPEEPRALLWTMLGAVFLVLLIACANVANLLLSRAASRTKEVGIRTALGASRARVIGQFIAEALVLAGVGALLGIGLAWLGVELFVRSIASTSPPYWIDIALHPPVLAFAIGVAALAAVISGIFPALQASRLDVSEILKDESRGSSSMRIGKLSRILVVTEIALSCGLLVGAGLMIKSVTKLRSIDFGFDGEQIFTARVGLPEADYADTLSQTRFWEELHGRLRAMPGVESVSLTTNLPALGSGRSSFAMDGATYNEDREYPLVRRILVSPAYFETFETPVRRGRDFGTQDRAGSLPVGIVNASFAATYFPSADPLGARIRFGASASTQPWVTIVGVVPDRFAGNVENQDPEAVYVPISQHAARFMSVAARTRGSAASLAAPVRDAVIGVDADIPIYFVRTHADAVRQNTWFYRVFGSLFMIFGVVALFLAGIGLYAVMAFSVGQRTREVGVRMALGARSLDVVGLVFRQGVVQIAVGMVLGLALAAGVSRLVQTVLFDVQPRDPAIFVGVVLVLASAGALACLLPARRATRIDPMVALRAE